jgi:endonuclease-3 related protein
MVGAVLTQNTNWRNVEQAIHNLKMKKLLSINKIDELSTSQLAKEIESAGFYRIKARRLKALVNYLRHRYNSDIEVMTKEKIAVLRKELLDIYGIGEETADSILLYGLGKAVFVIDAYTRRIFSRHKYFRESMRYSDIQKFFVVNLPKSVKLYNEYHALLVRLAKDFCRTKPLCEQCLIKGY